MPFNNVENLRLTHKKLEWLRLMLQAQYESGEPRDYAVYIDGMKVIHRTSNPDLFDSIEELLDDDTKLVTVHLYNKQSNNSDTYNMYRDLPGGLSGLDLQQERQKWETELEHRENRRKLEEAEERIEELEAELAQLRQKPGLLGEITGALVSLAKNNPQLLSKVPMLAGLAGTASPELPQESEVQGEVSFARKTDAVPPLSEADQSYLAFMKKIQGQFDARQFHSIISILNRFAEDTTLINQVEDLLT